MKSSAVFTFLLTLALTAGVRALDTCDDTLDQCKADSSDWHTCYVSYWDCTHSSGGQGNTQDHHKHMD